MKLSPHWIDELVTELKRRRVFRVATLYVVVTWPLVQLADILSPALQLLEQLMRQLLLAFLAGLPLVLILSWIFDVNRGGLVRAGGATDSEPLLPRRAETWFVVILLLVISALFYLQLTYSPAEPEPETSGSIAVIPFTTYEESERDQQFALGLTEELLNALARIRELRVVARTSSFAYQGVMKDIRTIGRELGVNHILEGSIRHNDVDDTIRVTAQLVDVESGISLWSKTYDRKFKDIFKIQDDIAGAVVNELELNLLGQETNRFLSRPSASTDAMVEQSLGRTELSKRHLGAIQAAIRHFSKAVAADPGYVEALSGLADAQALASRFETPEAHLEQATAIVDRALEQHPDSGLLWASRGLILSLRKEQEPARAALEKAIRLSPSYAMAHMWYGNLIDNPKDRLASYERAWALDPRSPVIGQNLANALIRDGREADAMEVFNRIIETDPFYAEAYDLVADINEFHGRLDASIQYHLRAWNLRPNAPTALALAELYSDLGLFPEADLWLGRVGSDLPIDQQSDLAWLRITTRLARKDVAGARVLMQQLRTRTPGTLAERADQVIAAYHMEDYPAVIRLYRESLAAGLPQGDAVESADLQIALAHAWRQTGNQTAADATLGALEDRLLTEVQQNQRVEPELWYHLARIAALRGEPAMVLAHLQRAVSEGWRQEWRPQVDPLLASLVREPRFSSMMLGLRSRLDLMREQIAMDDSLAGWDT